MSAMIHPQETHCNVYTLRFKLPNEWQMQHYLLLFFNSYSQCALLLKPHAPISYINSKCHSYKKLKSSRIYLNGYSNILHEVFHSIASYNFSWTPTHAYTDLLGKRNQACSNQWRVPGLKFQVYIFIVMVSYM